MKTIINPNQKKIGLFHEGLRGYNSQFLKPDFLPFSAVLENNKNEIIGGINGLSYWGRLHIDNIWIHEKYRGNGLGKKLIIKAENEAIRRKCKGIDLDTFSFQAPGFYEKLEFKKIGQIKHYKKDFKRIYYSKEFKIA